MKSSTKHKTEGRLYELKGMVKEFAGVFTNNPKLRAEGACEKIAGKFQNKIGQFEKYFEKH